MADRLLARSSMREVRADVGQVRAQFQQLHFVLNAAPSGGRLSEDAPGDLKQEPERCERAVKASRDRLFSSSLAPTDMTLLVLPERHIPTGNRVEASLGRQSRAVVDVYVPASGGDRRQASNGDSCRLACVPRSVCCDRRERIHDRTLALATAGMNMGRVHAVKFQAAQGQLYCQLVTGKHQLRRPTHRLTRAGRWGRLQHEMHRLCG